MILRKQNVPLICILSVLFLIEASESINQIDPAFLVVNKKTSLEQFEPNDLITVTDRTITHNKGLRISKAHSV